MGRRRTGIRAGEILHLIFWCLVIILSFSAGCRGVFASESQAVRALENAGYSDVKITDHHWVLVGLQGCGADAAKFDATAINPTGRKVDVYVCVGWPLKGATIRSD